MGNAFDNFHGATGDDFLDYCNAGIQETLNENMSGEELEMNEAFIKNLMDQVNEDLKKPQDTEKRRIGVRCLNIYKKALERIDELKKAR